MHIPPGITLLKGASGSGKTTLLKLINNTKNPTKGEVCYKNMPVQQYNPVQLRRKILLMGQTPYLFPGTIADNFNEYHQYRKETPPSQTQIENYLETTHLPHRPDYPISQLSGGETQRAYLAIMLSLKPETLLADEPTSALDEPLAQKVLTSLCEHCNANSVNLIIISHHPELVQNRANREYAL